MLTTLQTDTDLRRWCIQEAKDIVQIDKKGEVLEVAKVLYDWISDLEKK